MPVQPQFVRESPADSPDSDLAPQPGPALGPVTLWMQRISLFILVVFCVYLGIFMTILPWWSEVWDHNPFFLSHPFLWSIMRQGATRGIISGCGLLDIWIGISEAVHYREPKR